MAQRELLPTESTLSQRFFGSGEISLGRLLEQPRHIRIWALGDRHGNVMHGFERECPVQRRHQQVIDRYAAVG